GCIGVHADIPAVHMELRDRIRGTDTYIPAVRIVNVVPVGGPLRMNRDRCRRKDEGDKQDSHSGTAHFERTHCVAPFNLEMRACRGCHIQRAFSAARISRIDSVWAKSYHSANASAGAMPNVF